MDKREMLGEVFSPEEELDRQLKHNREQLSHLHAISRANKTSQRLVRLFLMVLIELGLIFLLMIFFPIIRRLLHINAWLEDFAGPIFILVIFGVWQAYKFLLSASIEASEIDLLIDEQQDAIAQAQQVLLSSDAR